MKLCINCVYFSEAKVILAWGTGTVVPERCMYSNSFEPVHGLPEYKISSPTVERLVGKICGPEGLAYKQKEQQTDTNK